MMKKELKKSLKVELSHIASHQSAPIKAPEIQALLGRVSTKGSCAGPEGSGLLKELLSGGDDLMGLFVVVGENTVVVGPDKPPSKSVGQLNRLTSVATDDPLGELVKKSYVVYTKPMELAWDEAKFGAMKKICSNLQGKDNAPPPPPQWIEAKDQFFCCATLIVCRSAFDMFLLGSFSPPQPSHTLVQEIIGKAPQDALGNQAEHALASLASMMLESPSFIVQFTHGFQEEMRLGFHILEKRTEHLKQEAANMMKKIGLLKAAKRKFLGEGLGACSIEELQWIEQQLERSLSNVRARKEKVLLDENAKLTENGRLFEKVKLLLFGINFVWPIVHLDNILKQIEAVANYQGDIYMGKPVRINCQKAIQRMKCSALSSRPLSTSPNQLDGDKITGATNHKSVNLEGSLLVQHLFKDHRRCSYMIANALDKDGKFTTAQVSRKLKQLGLYLPLKSSGGKMHPKGADLMDRSNERMDESDDETLVSLVKR
ncbi:hypothetical protein JHK86_001057 [Glycine max]|nr:hypothetical protein JHK86_001057 [Glycine max]